MKRLIGLICVFSLTWNIQNAQTPTWLSATTIPTSYNLNDICFVDTLNGWAVGENGSILSSTDGGHSWNSQYNEYSLILRDVFFLDTLRGWAIGRNNIAGYVGRVFYTKNGGIDWYGRMTSVEDGVHFVTPDTGYVVGGRGTIKISTDGGDSWTEQPKVTTKRLRSIFFTDKKNGWIVGDTGTILRTINGGNNWELVSCPTQSDLRSIHFVSATKGWCSGYDGTILQSTDSGTSWQKKETGTSATIYSIRALSNEIIIAVGEGGLVLKSIDGGETWKGQLTGTTSTIQGVSFVGETHGWIAGKSGSIRYTTNCGGTGYFYPTILNDPLNESTDISVNPKLCWLSSIGCTSYSVQLAFDNRFTKNVQLITGLTDSSHTFSNLTGDTTYYWRVAAQYGNGPIMWSKIWTFRTTISIPEAPQLLRPENSYNPLPTTLKFDWSKTRMASGYYLQVDDDFGFSSPLVDLIDIPDTTFTVSGLAYNELYFWHVASKNSAGMSSFSIYESFRTEGPNWHRIDYDTHMPYQGSMWFNSPMYGFVGTFGAKVYRTIDGGASWTIHAVPTESYQNINSIQFTDSLVGFCADDYGRIFKTEDGGFTWEKLISELTYIKQMDFVEQPFGWMMSSTDLYKTIDWGENWNIQFSGTGSSFTAFDFIDSLHGWIIINNGVDGTVLRTVDGGKTWLPGYTYTTNYLRAVCGITPEVVFLAGNSAILLKSTDGGNTWIPQNTGIESWDHIYCITAIDSLNLYCGTNGGIIYRTADGGMNWIDTKSIGSSVNQLMFNDKHNGWALMDGAIFKTNSGGGLTTLIDEKGINSASQNHYQLRSYPNPFKQSTTISFSLPFRSLVSLKIINLEGSVVATILSEDMQAGSYSYKWNAFRIPNGVYFYRLQTDTFIQTKQLIKF